jgi:hypothetical protein
MLATADEVIERGLANGSYWHFSDVEGSELFRYIPLGSPDEGWSGWRSELNKKS